MDGSLSDYIPEPKLEVEIASEAVSSLDDNVVCDKNPGHTEFISYSNFKPGHLPKAFRLKRLYKYLRNVGDSVVRLTVTCEDGSVRFGTGVIMKYRGKLYIYTNNHVVETDYQAKHCQIDFHYDKENCFSMKSSKGTALVHTFFETDKSMITFDPIPPGFDHSYMPDSGRCRGILKTTFEGNEIHLRGFACIHKDRHCIVVNKAQDFEWSSELIRSLSVYFREFDDGEKIFTSCTDMFDSDDKYVFLLMEPVPDMIRDELEKEEHFWKYKDSRGTLPIVIAHPHGGPKMVSIGKKIEVEKKEDAGVVLHHSAATCPGSSGGAVIAVGDDNLTRGLYNYLYLHCQGCRTTKYVDQTGSENLNTSSLSIWL